jgi:general stress protein 26
MNTEVYKAQLEESGLPHPERHPFTTNYLPRALHKDERIMAAVFGRRKESEGFFGFVEGLLVATDKRILFLDHRPGYTTIDEISYDVVSGVNITSTIFYASIILFTKIANYKLSFANHESAQRFVDYIENRVLDHEVDTPPAKKPPYETVIHDQAMNFLNSHEIGVLSSIERTGTVSGAVVYYTMIDGHPYFVTKVNSQKATNIIGDQHVAFTVFDEGKLQTIQIQGIVEQVNDKDKKTFALTDITRPRTYEDGSHKIPIMRMGDTDFITYRVIPTKYNFTDYQQIKK